MAKRTVYGGDSLRRETKFVDETTPRGDHKVVSISLSKNHARGAILRLECDYAVWVPDFSIPIIDWPLLYCEVQSGGKFELYADDEGEDEFTITYTGRLTFTVERGVD